MTKQVIFDWETLDNKPTSVVLSMAILVFDPAELVDFQTLVGRAKRIKLDWKSQLGGCRTMGQSVVDWWKHPDQATAKARVVDYDGSEVSLLQLPQIVKEYLDSMGYDPTADNATVWTRGNNFDPPIVDDIYEQVGADVPYSWWNVRDVRTYIDAMTQLVEPNYVWWGNDKTFEIPEGFIKHVEEHDCAVDVMKMQWATAKVMNMMSNLQKQVPKQVEAPRNYSKTNVDYFDDNIPF